VVGERAKKTRVENERADGDGACSQAIFFLLSLCLNFRVETRYILSPVLLFVSKLHVCSKSLTKVDSGKWSVASLEKKMKFYGDSLIISKTRMFDISTGAFCTPLIPPPSFLGLRDGPLEK